MNDNAMLINRFEDALVYATRLHANQKRKGTDTPYISHLMAVSGLVLENGGTENEAIAALLHDAVEDQGGASTLAEIDTKFGKEVAQIVSSCSDTDTEPKPPWRARKEAYIAAIAHKSASARLVSCADKVHNVRTIIADYRQHGEALWKRFNAGKDDQLWYYTNLASAFDDHLALPIADELRRAVSELQHLSQA